MQVLLAVSSLAVAAGYLLPDTLSWRLRGWSGSALLAYWGGDSPKTHARADYHNLLALLIGGDVVNARCAGGFCA